MHSIGTENCLALAASRKNHVRLTRIVKGDSQAAVHGRQIYRAGFVECKLSRQLRTGDDYRIVCLGEESKKRAEANAFERAPEGTHQSHKARGVFDRRARPERKTAALICESLYHQQSAPAEAG